MLTQTHGGHCVPQQQQKQQQIFHDTEPLKSVLMWGINYCMTQLDYDNSNDMMTPEDFRSFQKVKLNRRHFNGVGSNLPARFSFKEYCPAVFAALRRQFDIDSGEFLASWTRHPPAWDASSRGHSHSRFLRSHNGHYYIKTIDRGEVAALHRLLDAYLDHVTQCQAETLLPQLLALYRVGLDGKKHYLLVMRSVFSHRHRLLRKYDLKGCRVARLASTSAAASTAATTTTLKDLDFVRAGECIRVGDEAKARLMRVLRGDVRFLERRNVMDYSLLVGVHEEAAAASVADEEEQTKQQQQQPLGDNSDDSSDNYVAEEEDTLNDPYAYMAVQQQQQQQQQQQRSLSRRRSSVSNFDRFLVPCSTGVSGGRGSDSLWGYSFGLIDILTDYGLRKRAASAFKLARYGTGVDNAFSSVPPAAYATRFVDFVDACIQ